jgi:hypothetical protein
MNNGKQRLIDDFARVVNEFPQALQAISEADMIRAIDERKPITAGEASIRYGLKPRCLEYIRRTKRRRANK